MKFNGKISKGSDIFERLNDEIHDQLEDMDHYFHDCPPAEFARWLNELNDKWQAFFLCVRSSIIEVDNVLSETPDAPESEV